MKISIIIPAYNEEKNIDDAVKDISSAMAKEFKEGEWEIIIFDDCSQDRTGEIADKLAKQDSFIKVIHNETNKGLGYNFRKGVEIAKGEYVTWFPGDNENPAESLMDTIRHISEADIIIPYTANQEVREKHRRVISGVYTFLNNIMFGLKIRYYNGLSVYKRDMLLRVPPWGNSFAFAVEILVPLLKSGFSFLEIPIKIRPTTKTSALKIKNIIKVGLALLKLFWRINIKRERI
ncbi:MAG: glycosyltransferase family 2 protein [Candidatus Marinimicrobia bacterium]|nr:glycosyltransferase family 2 protein [Candidatus Neomarinimicrobiota bacterium]